MTEEEAIEFLKTSHRFPTEEEATAFLDEEPEKPQGFSIGREIGTGLRALGTLGGSLALLPGAGIRAGIELLPTISTDPDKLIDPGSLEEAEATLEEIGGTPGQFLLKTLEQARIAEEAGAIIAKPFEMAGKGWGLIGKEINEAVAKHYGVDPEDSALEPFLATIGEASAVFAMGSRLFRQKFKAFKKGLGAKATEARLRAGEVKHGKVAVVPEKVTLVEPKVKVAPLSPESKFAKKEFAERFLEGEEISPTEVKKVPPVKEKVEGVGKPTTIEQVINQNPKNIWTQDDKGKWWNTNPKYALENPEKIFIRNEKGNRIPIKSLIEEVGKKPPADVTLYSGIPIHKAAQAYTKHVGEPVWDKLVMKGIPKLLEKVPGGKSINRLFLYEYRGNLPDAPGYLKSFENMKRYQDIGREYAIDLGKRLQAIPEADQFKLGEYIRGEIKELSPRLRGLGSEAKRSLYDLGKQAVDAGLLAEETFFKNAGRYMPRLYTSKEYQSLLIRHNLTKPNRLDLSRFKRRKDIPKEIRQAMGEILTPGYPVAKGITQLTHDIEMARFFTGIATNKKWSLPSKKGFKVLPADVEGKTWGAWEGDTLINVFDKRGDALKAMKEARATWEEANPVPEGWKQLPSNKKLGKLSDAYVHPEIFKDLQETIRVMETPERVWRTALGSWKFGKVILSPKTHIRNLMSNSVLAHLGGLPMYEQPIYLTKAAKAMRAKGNYWKAAKEEGLLKHTFTNAELRTLFDQVEGEMGGIKATSIPEKLGNIGIAWDKTKKGLGKAADLYQAEEAWFKMAKFIHNVERKGMDFKVAAADAEKWLFNYQKITRFQEKYRSKWYGAPFATFTFKALPRIAEAMIKTPWRFALPMGMIYALEQAAQTKIGDTPEQIKAKKALRPEWQKGNMLGTPNFARVPFVDEYGREYYLNLTYILPWGDIGEGGRFMGIPGGTRPFSQPFLGEPVSQIFNYDPFWKQPIFEETELAGKTKAGKIKAEAKARLIHAGRAMLPTPFVDIEKGISALRGKPDIKGRLRPSGIVAADVFLGLKMYPVSYIEEAEKKINKLHPKKGYIARKILGQIKTLSIKKEAVEKAGGNVAFYEKKIEDKINQLKGLAKETAEIGELFRQIKVHIK